MPELETTKRLSTGIAGLDEVLHGGLLPYRSYLVRGTPGTGKTTLAMHFVQEAAKRGERHRISKRLPCLPPRFTMRVWSRLEQRTRSPCVN